MWNFLWRGKQRKQWQQDEREFKWTVIAPETRGQEETMALRDNADDLGAAVALRQVIEASRPRSRRELSSHTTPNLRATTHVSAISADSEDYVRNPYTDTGRRQPRQDGGATSSPLAVVSPTRAADSVDDYANDDRSNSQKVEQPQSIRRNLLTDPVETLLHLTAAAALASGPPGRQYITSGPPPPDQRGRAQTNSQAQPLATPRPPRRALTQRHRAASSPAVLRDRHGVSGSRRSTRSL